MLVVFVFQLSEGQKLTNPNLGKLVLLRTKNGQLMALPAAQFQQLQQQQQQQQQKLQAEGGMPPRASSAPPPPQTQIIQTYQQQSSSRPGTTLEFLLLNIFLKLLHVGKSYIYSSLIV